MNLKLKSALGVAVLLVGAQAMAQVTFYEGEGFRGRAFSTDPESPFVRSGSVQRVFEDGWASVKRGSLAGRRAGIGLDRELADEADWLAELERQFGLVVRGSEVRNVG